MAGERGLEVDPFVGTGSGGRVPDEIHTVAVYVHATEAFANTFPEIQMERLEKAMNVEVKVTDQAGLNAEYQKNCGTAPAKDYPGVRLTQPDGTQTIVTTTDNPHIAAHETGHTLQNPELKTLGVPVFEAFNEKFTEDLCSKYGMQDKQMNPCEYAVNGNVAAVRGLEKLVGEKVVAEANFGKGGAEVENLKNAIDNASRPGTADHVFELMNNGNGWDAAAYIDFWVTHGPGGG